MKNLIYELNVTKILLIISSISVCIVPNAYAISLVAIALVVHSLVDRYLSIILIHKESKQELDSLNSKIFEIENKLSHLITKDTTKDLMAGLASNNRR